MTDSNRKGFEKPDVDEDYLMDIMSGDDPAQTPVTSQQKKPTPPRQRQRKTTTQKPDYETTFLVNRFSSGRNGKVVYIRPEYHERLQRIVRLSKEERVTLYAYIDNILEHHFKEFGDDIMDYFNKNFKPIL